MRYYPTLLIVLEQRYGINPQVAVENHVSYPQKPVPKDYLFNFLS